MKVATIDPKVTIKKYLDGDKKSITKANAVDTFKRAFADTMNSLVEVARFYVAIITEHPDLKEKLHQELPLGSLQWNKLEMIGHGLYHHKLWMLPGPEAKKIGALPPSDQERITDGTVDLLLNNGDSLKVKWSDLNKDQKDQLLDGTRIRTLAQQKVYMESKKPAPKKSKAWEPPYTIQGRGKHVRVIVSEGYALTKDDLADIMRKI